MEKSSNKVIRIAIHQPGYHRYCGYFYKMYKSDLFISLDTAQYVAREWQNRQIFYSNRVSKWLSVPVDKGREPIKDKKIVNPSILRDHWEYIKSIYRKSPYFERYSGSLASIYLDRKWEYLNDLCDALTLLAKDILGIKTKYVRDSQNNYVDRGLKKADALIDAIRRAVNIENYDKVIYLPRNYPIPKDFYLNLKFEGSNKKEIEKFKDAGIGIQTYNFQHPSYKQFQNSEGSGFVPNLSIYDLIFNCEQDPLEVLKSGGDNEYRN